MDPIYPTSESATDQNPPGETEDTKLRVDEIQSKSGFNINQITSAALLFPNQIQQKSWDGVFITTVKRSGSPLGEPPSKKRPPLEILPPARAFYVPPIILPEEALQMLMPAAYQAGPAVSSPATASIVDTSGMQQKDTTWTKLFVGGLPYHTTDSTLRDHFKVYGEIDEAVVITDRQTGKSRGYGFVIMADRISAERACKEPNPIIDGRKANVNLAILGAKPRGNAVAAAAAAASFPFVRAGYPASLLASNYGLPATALYQPAAYQPTMLPNSGSLATALATQFYDFHQPALTAAAQFPGAPFGQTGFDPYATYLAQLQAQSQAVQQSQQHAASYAAYLPTASANPTTATVLNPYAQPESRIQ